LIEGAIGRGRRRLLTSDRYGELIECGRETQALSAGFDTEFVVAAPDVLEEGVSADHRRR
jgi:hypothetical protein